MNSRNSGDASSERGGCAGWKKRPPDGRKTVRENWWMTGFNQAWASGDREKNEVLELGDDAEFFQLGQVGCPIRRERAVHDDGEPDARKLEDIEEGEQMLEGWT